MCGVTELLSIIYFIVSLEAALYINTAIYAMS